MDIMMNNTWQARELGHGFSVVNLEQVAAKGWLRCFALRAGGKIIAFVAGYQGMGTLVYEIVGYDQAWRHCSPGGILLQKLLERLYEANKPMFVDYGEGKADYKNAVANDTILVNYTFVVKRGTGAACRIHLYCMARRAIAWAAATIRKRRS